MIKKLLLLAAAVGIATSCVDSDFDLSKIDSDDIGVGNDASEFRLPLANISVKTSALDGVAPLNEIFAEADVWTPSDYSEIDLVQLSGGGDYLSRLLDALLVEVATNAAKRHAVAQCVGRNADYSRMLNGLSNYDAQTLIDEHYDEYRDAIGVVLKQISTVHLQQLTSCVNNIEVSLDGFGIDQEMIDALSSLGEGLSVYGACFNRLPVEGNCRLGLYPDNGAAEPAFFALPELQVSYNRQIDIDKTPIDREALTGMNNPMVLRADFGLTTYYPGQSIPGTDEAAIELTLKLEKLGGINLGDL